MGVLGGLKSLEVLKGLGVLGVLGVLRSLGDLGAGEPGAGRGTVGPWGREAVGCNYAECRGGYRYLHWSRVSSSTLYKPCIKIKKILFNCKAHAK
jgi:hypothetical protein